LDNIHFGNKTDVDILVWWKRTHLTTEKTVWSYPSDYLLGLPLAAMETLLVLPVLPPLQLVVEKEAKQAAYILHCSNCSNTAYKSDWIHSAIFKMATEDFLVLLTITDRPLEVFD
jgi:hypothetical protein